LAFVDDFFHNLSSGILERPFFGALPASRDRQDLVSLYLWQQLFCRNLAESTPESTWLGSLQHRPQSFLLSFVFAVLSYFLVEKPMIRLGHQLSPPVTAGHEDLSSPPLGEPSTTVAKANL